MANGIPPSDLRDRLTSCERSLLISAFLWGVSLNVSCSLFLYVWLQFVYLLHALWLKMDTNGYLLTTGATKSSSNLFLCDSLVQSYMNWITVFQEFWYISSTHFVNLKIFFFISYEFVKSYLYVFAPVTVWHFFPNNRTCKIGEFQAKRIIWRKPMVEL